MKIYTDSGYTETEHLGNILHETGSYKKVVALPPYRVIDDSLSWSRYTSSDMMPPYYVRTGTWLSFYPGGAVQSAGKYLPEQFDVSCPKPTIIRKGFEPGDWYNKDGSAFSGFYAGCCTYLKDSTWTYYGPDRKIQKREYYKNGLKLKEE